MPMEIEMGTTGTGLPSQYTPVLTMEKKIVSPQAATPRSIKNGQVRTVTRVRARGC
jgi:hypothetical protein